MRGKEGQSCQVREADHAVQSKAGIMANLSPSSLKEAPAPFTGARIARPTLSEEEKPSKLQPVVNRTVIRVLFAVCMARFRATQSFASRVTKWLAELRCTFSR